MKIYINAYLNQNLGDDLFIKTLTSRYNMHEFYSISNGIYYENSCFDHLKIYSNKFFYRIIRKFKLQKHLANMCNLVITIGGSMYIEKNDHDKNKDFKLGKQKRYILGCNFGPYKTEKYFNNVKKAFELAEDVCFREKYSYELFKDLNNVRYAPDILFSANINNVKITNKKRAVLSIISCQRKCGEEYKEDYEKKMIELIKFLLKRNYDICLMSFCKNEKDEEAIESILHRCDEETRTKIETYYYRGNIEEALNVIGNSSLVVGSRFHANILGMIMGKSIIPVIYSDKTKHVLEDMKINIKTIDIKNIKEFDINSISQEDLTKVIDVSKEKEESEKHFEKLDEILK